MEFDIDKQFRNYMEDLDIPISTLDAVTVRNLKRSFASGASSLFSFLYIAVHELSLEDGKKLASDLDKTFTEFFDNDFQSKITYHDRSHTKY